MKTFESISACREAIMDYRADHLADLPADIAAKFKSVAASPSPVDQIVGTMETLYASHADLNAAGQALVGGLAAFATTNAWHGLTDDNRGDRIVQAMRRELGDTPPSGTTFPQPDADPAAAPGYAIEKAADPALPPGTAK